MTPSGELADIILPAAHPNEVDRVEWAHSGHGYPTSHTYLIRQPFHEPLGESKDDMDISLRVREVHGRGHVLEGQVRVLRLHGEGPRNAASAVELCKLRGIPRAHQRDRRRDGHRKGRAEVRDGLHAQDERLPPRFQHHVPWQQDGDGVPLPRHEDAGWQGNSCAPAVGQRQDGNVVRRPAAVRQRPAALYIEPPITTMARPDCWTTTRTR